MSDETQIEQNYFATRFNGLMEHLSPDQTVLVKHLGELNQENIVKLESLVESTITDNNIPKGPLKKIFFISVETLQNMLIHGHRNNSGVQQNLFLLVKNHTKVEITSANLINNSAISTLEEQIKTINAFDEPAALKQFYMEHLEKNELSEKGGAGLGFITIAMKSGNKLKASFEKINDGYSMFMLTSTIGID